MLSAFSSSAQASFTDPANTEAAVSTLCYVEYPKLETDIATFGPQDCRLMAFVIDSTNTNGDEIQLTVINCDGDIGQYQITPSDVNTAIATNLGLSTFSCTAVFNPDVTIVATTSNDATVMVVFDTDDISGDYGACMMEFHFDPTGPTITISQTGLAEPVNFDGGTTYGYSRQPQIDGDKDQNKFAVVSLHDAGSGNEEVYTSYYEYSSSIYQPMASYVNMQASVLPSTRTETNPDIAFGHKSTTPFGPESVVCYIEEKAGTNPIVKVTYMNATPALLSPNPFSNQLNTVTALLDDNISYPRICSQPSFGTAGQMKWALAVSSLEPVSPPEHLWTVHSGNLPKITYPDETFYANDVSVNYMPALDWMTDDAIVAWRGLITSNSTYGVFATLNPYTGTGGVNQYYDWYKVNIIDNLVPTKNIVAVSSSPEFNGYLVAWYQDGKINYKTLTMNDDAFRAGTGSTSIIHESDKISILPNPASSEINIRLDGQNTTCTIFDFLGRQVESLECGKPNTIVDVSKYTNGTYILVTTTSSIPFVVNH